MIPYELSNRYRSYSPSLKLRRGRPCLIRKVLDVGAIMDTERQEDYEKCSKDFREPSMIFRQGEVCERKLNSTKGKHFDPRDVSSDIKRKHRNIVDAAFPKEWKSLCLMPKHRGYLKIFENSQISSERKTKFWRNIYCCLDLLPCMIRHETGKLVWTRNKSDSKLRTCLFYFENEDEFNALRKETLGESVHSRAFQRKFSSFLLGLIVLAQRGRNSDDPSPQTQVKSSKDAVYMSSCLVYPHRGKKTDFFLCTKSRDDEFNARKFRAATAVEKDKWMFHIQKLLISRQPGQKTGAAIKSTRHTTEKHRSSGTTDCRKSGKSNKSGPSEQAPGRRRTSSRQMRKIRQDMVFPLISNEEEVMFNVSCPGFDRNLKQDVRSVNPRKEQKPKVNGLTKLTMV